MSVLRIHKKQNNFVILDKTCLCYEKLSWGAKGLHAFLISLPDNWQVRVSDLQKRATNGRDAVRAFLSELEATGYIKKAIKRNEETGRFGGMEYLVLETPDPEFKLNSPDTENQPIKPETEKPLAGNPAPGNPTLISINRINNNKINNKTAAETKTNSDQNKQKEQAAAVFYQGKKEAELKAKSITAAKPEDSIIGVKLTELQCQRIEEIVANINPNNPKQLVKEIIFCILNPKSFTACGQEFARKLNAIRSVIKRGDWQTPAELVLQHINTKDSQKEVLTKSLNEARAEKAHFERLLPSVNEHTRCHFLTIIAEAQKKIQALESKLRNKEELLKQRVG